MATEITEQNYPKLCFNCIREDGRTELDNKMELVKFQTGQKSAISKEDVEKYRMAWDSENKFYVCQRCKAPSAPDIPVKLFWNTCSKCGQIGLNFENQEKTIHVPKTERRPIHDKDDPQKVIGFNTVIVGFEKIQNENQLPIKCKSCGHEGKDNDGRLY